MLTATPLAYARLPTYSSVIDRLASGLGISQNKEDALCKLGSFGGRIDAYSGSPHRPGLEDRILDMLADSNGALRSLVRARLLDAETALTDARAIPLVTEATETEGLRRFIEIWAAPWIAKMLADASHHPESVLDSIRLLLEAHVATPTSDTKSHLTTWKAAIKREIPEGVNAREFRLTIAKLDQRSQRKHSSIEQDIANLRLEMRSGFSSDLELDAAVEKVRRIYLAGMVTMRLCAMAAKIIPENNLLALVAGNPREDMNKIGDASEQAQDSRIRMYWGHLDPAFKLSTEFKRLSALALHHDAPRFDQLRADSRTDDHAGLLMPAIDYSEGRWHLCHGRNDLAERYLQRVVKSANGRQLGATAAYAASYLIALRLIDPGALKFEALNPLLRVRIDNMPQVAEMYIDYIPTPFSDYSPRPKPSFYDSHLMQCVACFNDLPRPLESLSICNPLQRFDAGLEKLIIRSHQTGAKLTELERKRPAIFGTSVRPYQVLRDHLYYRDALFGLNQSNLPGMDAYWMLPQPDQLRLLRFIDPEQFKLDLQAHGLDSWRHPDDVP